MDRNRIISQHQNKNVDEGQQADHGTTLSVKDSRPNQIQKSKIMSLSAEFWYSSYGVMHTRLHLRESHGTQTERARVPYEKGYLLFQDILMTEMDRCLPCVVDHPPQWVC